MAPVQPVLPTALPGVTEQERGNVTNAITDLHLSMDPVQNVLLTALPVVTAPVPGNVTNAILERESSAMARVDRVLPNVMPQLDAKCPEPIFVINVKMDLVG